MLPNAGRGIRLEVGGGKMQKYAERGSVTLTSFVNRWLGVRRDLTGYLGRAYRCFRLLP